MSADFTAVAVVICPISLYTFRDLAV